jgi:serine/threonine-protein kinase HipA
VITAQDPAQSLSVFMDQTRVGSLYNTQPLAFSHDTSWLTLPDSRPIDSQIPLGPERIATPYVHAFFENLLPEGNQRKLISMRHHVTRHGAART